MMFNSLVIFIIVITTVTSIKLETRQGTIYGRQTESTNEYLG